MPKYNLTGCHLFSIDDVIVWGKDAAFVAKVEKEAKAKLTTKAVTGCIEGDCYNGQGTETFPNGYKYVGEFKNGKRNGQGTSTWGNGDKYVGEWKNNLPNGQGTYTFAGGKKIVGEWKDGLTVQDFQEKEKQKAGTVNYVFNIALYEYRGQGVNDKHVFTKKSPTTLKKLTFNKERNVETLKGDKLSELQRYKKKRFKSFQFTAEYEENITVEIFVEHQDDAKNLKRAETQAFKYANMFGQMPHFLKIYTDKIYVHKDEGKDTGMWWAQPRKKEFHIKRSRCSEQHHYSDCAVVMLHELAHIIQDLTGVISPSKWGEAKRLDNKKYCTKYAKTNDFEDFAESVVCWVAVRYKSDQLMKNDLEKIKEYIPNRLKFFDELNFNMYPIVKLN